MTPEGTHSSWRVIFNHPSHNARPDPIIIGSPHNTRRYTDKEPPVEQLQGRCKSLCRDIYIYIHTLFIHMICVCIYIYIVVIYICIYIYIHGYVCIYTVMRVYINIYIYTDTHINTPLPTQKIRDQWLLPSSVSLEVEANIHISSLILRQKPSNFDR